TGSPQFAAGTEPPFLDSGKGTAVAVSVSIDRRTRSALDQHLFHVEFVPAGSVFTIEITAQNLSESDIGAVLGLLEQFGQDSTLSVGAHSVHGWGRLAWGDAKVFCIDRAGVAAWLAKAEAAGFAAAEADVTD